jgi:uncharacterized protein (TIGR02145 family)
MKPCVLPLIGVCLLTISSCECENQATAGKVVDIDGNIYIEIVIGNQLWLDQNLTVTRYRNGDLIPNIIPDLEWGSQVTGAYCDYDNSPSNRTVYGLLYNWYTVDDPRGLCPTGWHVPTNSEWSDLIDYLGGGEVAGGKLKEAGLDHWTSPNTGASNDKAFSALPGGFRTVYNQVGEFLDITNFGFWWSASTGSEQGKAQYRGLSSTSIEVLKNEFSKASGFSVRCVKD